MRRVATSCAGTQGKKGWAVTVPERCAATLAGMETQPDVKRRSPWIALGLWATTVVIAIMASRYSSSVVVTPHGDTGDPLAAELAFLAIYVTLASVGAVVAWRRPGHVMGWLFLVCAWLFVTSELAHGYAHDAVLTGATGSTLAGWAAMLGVTLFLPPFVLMTMYLPLVFPDGQLLTPRWRLVVFVLAGVVLVLTLAEALSPGAVTGFPEIRNPLGLVGAEAALAAAAAVADPLFIPVLVAIGVSVVLRYRRATSTERQQFKWVALPAAVLLVFLPLNEFVLRDATGPVRALGSIVFFAAFAGLPLGLAVAVLRFRLYEIDRILSRTVTYAALSVLMIGVYAAGVVTIGATVRALSGGASSELVVAVSTLIVAAAFRPARRRIQRAVDRRFDRTRYDAARTIEGFGQRLRSELDPDTLLLEIQRVVHTSIQPVTSAVWIRPGADARDASAARTTAPVPPSAASSAPA
jgi:hypothetical protein